MDLSIALAVAAVWAVVGFIVGRVYEADRQRGIFDQLIDQDNLTREAWDQVNAGL